LRTRVGYAGGTQLNPTYETIGDHTESVQIDYDPNIITYEQLLAVFWKSHSPEIPSYSRQYASIIFYHDETQRRLAEESKARQEEQAGQVHTEILPAGRFYLAEDYHQKYQLSHLTDLAQVLRALYPNQEDYVNSTVTARANAFAAGYLTYEEFVATLESLLIPEGAKQEILQATRWGQF